MNPDLLPDISDFNAATRFRADNLDVVSDPIALRLVAPPPAATLATDLWGLPMWAWLLFAIFLGALAASMFITRSALFGPRRTHRLGYDRHDLTPLLSEGTARGARTLNFEHPPAVKPRKPARPPEP
jgi:hypothetical protein